MTNKIISAINIHLGGGLIYLFLLHSFLDREENIIFFDQRAKSKLPIFNKAKLIFFKKGPFRNIKILFFRLKTYCKVNKNNNFKGFSEIYLNGIPPLFRFFPNKVNTYIFFQNKLIFDEPFIKPFSINNLKVVINVFIYKFLLSIFLNNRDILIAQTNSMFKIISTKYLSNRVIKQESIWGKFDRINMENLHKSLIEKYSPIVETIKKLSIENFLLFYPATLYLHKNHKNLFKAIDLLETDSLKRFKLILTIKESDLNTFLIKNKSNILCIGEISYSEILKIYSLVDYLLYPSISESFGLPLLEAKLNNTKIIASNLDYVFDVCEPELVFNPIEYKDIYKQLNSVLKI